MFQVFDKDRPADHTSFPSLEAYGWANSRFNTFEEALKYARMWCAPFGSSYDGKEGFDLEVGVPYDYSGYGDTIEIRKVE